MAVISNVGSPEYYELRAIEEIHTARNIRYPYTQLPMSDSETERYHYHITKAI